MSDELSDRQLDVLLSSADGFVGQGGALVAELAGAVRQLRKSLVTVNPSGKTFRLDRLAECEDALDTWQGYAAAAEAERDHLAAIVRDLAVVDPTGFDPDCCTLCRRVTVPAGAPHSEVCPWVRARAFLASRESDA